MQMQALFRMSPPAISTWFFFTTHSLTSTSLISYGKCRSDDAAIGDDRGTGTAFNVTQSEIMATNGTIHIHTYYTFWSLFFVAYQLQISKFFFLFHHLAILLAYLHLSKNKFSILHEISQKLQRRLVKRQILRRCPRMQRSCQVILKIHRTNCEEQTIHFKNGDTPFCFNPMFRLILRGRSNGRRRRECGRCLR